MYLSVVWMVRMKEMCVVYFKLCPMIVYVGKWCIVITFNNNITWYHESYIYIYNKIFIECGCINVFVYASINHL